MTKRVCKRKNTARPRVPAPAVTAPYDDLVGSIADLLEEARRTSARAVNVLMTATYWEVGRRIVEFEQRGEARAEYGEELVERLSADLTARFGRGFSVRNVWQMKAFYIAWRNLQTPSAEFEAAGILQTVSAESRKRSIVQKPPGESTALPTLAQAFPLPWSAYVRLLSVKSDEARRFYETEALRGGWSVRQLGRQIDSQFYERTALSRNKAAMLEKGAATRPEDVTTPEEEVKDPFLLEFLGLKDEYSENDLEEALIRHLEAFLVPNKVLAAEYRTVLPDEELLAKELSETRRILEARRCTKGRSTGRSWAEKEEGDGAAVGFCQRARRHAATQRARRPWRE